MRAALAALALACAAACGGRDAPSPGPATQAAAAHAPLPAGSALAVTPIGATLVLEVAASPEARERGLMGRAEVPPGTGMLFLFDEPARYPFWMKNCLTAIDIAWLDERGTVVHLAERVPPCVDEPCPNYAPQADAVMVVEVGPGEARRLGVLPGTLLAIQTGGGGR